jgi:hypothetical protein
VYCIPVGENEFTVEHLFGEVTGFHSPIEKRESQKGFFKSFLRISRDGGFMWVLMFTIQIRIQEDKNDPQKKENVKKFHV